MPDDARARPTSGIVRLAKAPRRGSRSLSGLRCDLGGGRRPWSKAAILERSIICDVPCLGKSSSSDDDPLPLAAC